VSSTCDSCGYYHEDTLCVCERGYYNDCEYNSCYECYLDRREAYLSCVWCGRWHSPKYATCFKCRMQYGRDEAGRDLRVEILSRDGFRCQYCDESEGQLQIDHIKPCARGGTADPWNLQVLCSECNRDKHARWERHGPHFLARVGLMHYYFTFLWKYLTADQQATLRKDAESWEYHGHFNRHWRFREDPRVFCTDCDVNAEPQLIAVRCFACRRSLLDVEEAA
jgi:5-methylcytosine-specific restriction endonuclease McrA